LNRQDAKSCQEDPKIKNGLRNGSELPHNPLFLSATLAIWRFDSSIFEESTDLPIHDEPSGIDGRPVPKV
jgi:hypothetical protein